MLRVNVSEINSTLNELTTRVMALGPDGIGENTNVALNIAANCVAGEWRSYLNKEKAFPGSHLLKHPLSSLAGAIKVMPMRGSSIRIVLNKPFIAWMENGSPAFDMKNTHPYGPRGRMSKDGTPYVIVPFRQGVPTSRRNPMPQAIYAAVQKMIKSGDFKRSTVNDATSRSERNGMNTATVTRQGYSWGSSLEGLDPGLSKLEGMVAFPTAGVSSTTSQYFTFRVISAKSPDGAWLFPARPMILPHVIRATEDLVADTIEYGVKKDLGL